jgi:site-specific DNA-methyltransferase (adenine-specific)
MDKKFDTIFADPPDNIGLDYGDYDDHMEESDYVDLLGEWIFLFLQYANTVWLSFNAKWTPTVGYFAVEMDNINVKPCVQTFTFGQHRKTDLGNNHRPLWRFSHPGASLFPERVKVESWRQQHGDKRAAPGGKVPGDVFDFPRVTGNSKQRRKWHPTQLNEGLVERCIKLTTPYGGTVCDPFAGTGTTLRVAKRSGYNCSLIELNPNYCLHIAAEHEMEMRESGKYMRWMLDSK